MSKHTHPIYQLNMYNNSNNNEYEIPVFSFLKVSNVIYKYRDAQTAYNPNVSAFSILVDAKKYTHTHQSGLFPFL